MAGPRKVRIGSSLDKFPGRSWNLLVDGYNRQQGSLGRSLGRGISGQFLPVKAVNETGQRLEYGHCVAMEGLYQPIEDNEAQVYGRPLLKAQTPSDTLEHAIMGVSTGTVEAGQVGTFNVIGLAWIRWKVSDAAHHFAKLDPAMVSYDPAAISASAGYPVLDSEDVPGAEYLPAEIWALVLLGGDSGENFRLIRGQSVGAQAGATILLDNVHVLAGGLDPSDGNPATQVTVANIFSQSYVDNELVNAVFSEEETGGVGVHWETLKTTVGTDQYRFCRCLTKGAVTADDATFTVDNVVPLANGLDPVAGNMATELTVANSQLETFRDNEPIIIVYSASLPGWRTPEVERYRMIRGEVYAGFDGAATTFEIDHIVVLESGLDPRTDPTDVDEKIVVQNIYDDEGATDDKLIAVYNVVANQWEAIPRTAVQKRYVADATSAISAGSPASPTSGSAMVYIMNDDGSTTSIGSKTLWNVNRHAVKGALTVEKLDDDNFKIEGYDMLEALSTRDNFGPEKALAVGEGGSLPTDIEWLGKKCVPPP